MADLVKLADNLYRWSDICQVYVLRVGEACLLFDLGDGSVLPALANAGITSVEWVLFTHHHREQCQGATKIDRNSTKVACSAIERPFFETPLNYRKWRPTLGDAHTVHGASYVRPPIQPIRVDHQFSKMDTFEWRGHEIWCMQTPGNSPGSMTYLIKTGGSFIAITGDLMLDGAKMHTWYDTEWDYGFAKGIYELANSAGQLAGYDPLIMLPAHGNPIKQPKKQLLDYVVKLKKFCDLYVRGWDVNRFAACDQDTVSKPTKVPYLWQVSKHLYKFRGPEYWPNFHMVLSDNGHALFIDCGLFDRKFLDTTIQLMKDRLGLKAIDAVFVTHYHGDHALDAGHVRKQFGAKLWAMESVVDKFEKPWDHDLCAVLPAYNDRGKPDIFEPLKFDRTIRNGETIQWQGYSLTCDWMPGQTKYASCLYGEIDGQRVAFTGDNIFASPKDESQGGNECVVARNEAILEEGYLYAASYLHQIAPDLLLGGHCWAMSQPTKLIERLRVRMEALRTAYQGLSTDEDYRYMFDPYWVRAHPYRVAIKPGGTIEFEVIVRNFTNAKQSHRIEIHTPPGLTTAPSVITGDMPNSGRIRHKVQLIADQTMKAGMALAAFDITKNDVRHGELFDFIIQVE